MSLQVHSLTAALKEKQSLAVADRILINPEPGKLAARTQELISAVASSGCAAELKCQVLIRLGLNLAGRDALIVGYAAAEVEQAFEVVLRTFRALEPPMGEVMKRVVADFIADMKSVNRGDSLPGLLAERIEPRLDQQDAGSSFLKLMKEQIRGGVYWRMIGEGYAKFGNDYARGLEYLRHYGFCQVSTNPVLAAKAFDEDPKLTEELKVEIRQHPDWQRHPEAHADAIVMAATLIALWPNLAVFRPLALHSKLKDYMVSFQLNPNIADDADLSVADARQAYQLAADYLKRYDEWLELGDKAGQIGPNIVFKIAASAPAARQITCQLNSDGIGTNNTVVYSVAQEVRLILDAFQGKAEALKQGKVVTRTYETNMGGRFVSHLREATAEQIFGTIAEKRGQQHAQTCLDALAQSLQVDAAAIQAIRSVDVREKARTVCAFKYLKSLAHPELLKGAESAGLDAKHIQQTEEDLKKAGTLVARRVYGIFYSNQNRPHWLSYLQETYKLNALQAEEVLSSMDVLPASKRIPEDTYHALGRQNMCHTEFPNHSRAVQVMSETPGFRLEDFKDSVNASYDAEVTARLSRNLDFRLGYELTPELREILKGAGIKAVDGWPLGGIVPEAWPQFGPVQKTTAEFRAAYDAFAAKCVAVAKAAGA